MHRRNYYQFYYGCSRLISLKSRSSVHGKRLDMERHQKHFLNLDESSSNANVLNRIYYRKHVLMHFRHCNQFLYSYNRVTPLKYVAKDFSLWTIIKQITFHLFWMRTVSAIYKILYTNPLLVSHNNVFSLHYV